MLRRLGKAPLLVAETAGSPLGSWQRRGQFRMQKYRGPIPANASAETARLNEEMQKKKKKKNSRRAETMPSFIVQLEEAQRQREEDAEKLFTTTEKMFSDAEANEECWQFHPEVYDCNRLPLQDAPTLQDMSELDAMLPEPLQKGLKEFAEVHRIYKLTPAQKCSIPLVAEGRDVVCVAPTGSGKTLSYVLPSLGGLIGRRHARAMGHEVLRDGQLVMKTAEDFLKAVRQRQQGTCRVCGLDMTVVPVCPETGRGHRDISNAGRHVQLSFDHGSGFSRRRAKEMKSMIAAPEIVILTCRNELVAQIGKTINELLRYAGQDSEIKVGRLTRAVTEVNPSAEPEDEDADESSSSSENRKLLQEIKDCDILITTPIQLAVTSRLKKLISFGAVHNAVFDEVDELLCPQFYDSTFDVMKGLTQARGGRPQMSYFGATIPPETTAHLVPPFLDHNHRVIQGSSITSGLSRETNITHKVFPISTGEKSQKLLSLYQNKEIQRGTKTIVFVNSAKRVPIVAEELGTYFPELKVAFAHGKLPDEHRQSAIFALNRGGVDVLVCTDLCARGIDFQAVMNVVHYDMPATTDTFLHRSGRVGRRGLQGRSFAFFCPEDSDLAKSLVPFLESQRQTVPTVLKQYARMTPIDVYNRFLAPMKVKHIRKDSTERRFVLREGKSGRTVAPQNPHESSTPRFKFKETSPKQLYEDEVPQRPF